ncbi:MAG: nucleoside/nucleotide kinase family protein [Clostridia bacterium]|nr:nucleoside/nucleotide kinase family protein [Clostridia bacterium]
MALYRLCVNGFETEAVYSDKEDCLISGVLTKMISGAKKRKRKIVLIAGAPGAGKSTLALALCEKARAEGVSKPVQALGLDGFHLKNDVLSNGCALRNGESVPLSSIKGAPETFDRDAFLKYLSDAASAEPAFWPVYDRNRHEVGDTPERVKGEILIIEGNWLLLKREGWEKAKAFADITLSVSTEEAIVKPRLIQRKMRGGKSLEEAEKWYETVDGPNVRLFHAESAKADISLKLTENGLQPADER